MKNLHLPAVAEHVVQEGIVDLLRVAGHPRLIWYHVPNGEERSERVGAKLRRMGLVRGMADLALVLPGGQAAFLEVKAAGGRQSPEQVAFEQRCIETGAPYAIVRSLAEAMDVLAELGALSGKVQMSPTP